MTQTEIVTKPEEKTTPAKKTPEKALETAELTIHQKMLAIMEEIGVIDKTGSFVKDGKEVYKFLEQGAVMGKIKPLLGKYRIMVYPTVKGHHLHTTEKGMTKIVTDMEFEFVNVDKPEERFTLEWKAEGNDYGDKGTNKATTTAQKNLYIRVFNLSDFDPDAERIEDELINPEKATAKPKQVTMIATMLGNLGWTREQYESKEHGIGKSIEALKFLEAKDIIDKLQSQIALRGISSEVE